MHNIGKSSDRGGGNPPINVILKKICVKLTTVRQRKCDSKSRNEERGVIEQNGFTKCTSYYFSPSFLLGVLYD